MLFHTSIFTLFFSLTFALFLILRGQPRKMMLLGASWIFYGWIDWKFLALMLGSTSVDFAMGLLIDKLHGTRKRKFLLATSIVVNISFLSIFKYYDFFLDNVNLLLNVLGYDVISHAARIVLPAGISFYTFQSLSYVIDVYRREIPATKNFFDYALFVTFFPHLVAGPIQRASHLLPQLVTLGNTSLPNIMVGAHIFLIGLVYKSFMADNLGPLVDLVFNAPSADGLSTLLATYCFGFQIYGDFAGYSLMAIGLAQILGIHLTDNFRAPYLSLGAVEFWRKWHISLSSWFRDYLYIPLGGNRVESKRVFFNLMLVMLACGFWHGAGWNYVAWGGAHGLLIALDHYATKRKMKLPAFIQWAVSINLIFICWLLFRAQGIGQVVSMTRSLVFDFHLSSPWGASSFIKALCIYALPIMVVEFLLQRAGKKYWFEGLPMPARVVGFAILVFVCLTFGNFSSRPFIYFAF